MSAVLTAQRTELGLAALPAAADAVLSAVAEHAGAVDRSEADLWEALHELGALDLLTAPLAETVELTHALARRCTPTAFSLWGHRSSVAYHEVSGAALPEGAADGAVPLASGMAPAYKEEAGLGEIQLVATDLPAGGIEVSGVLPWCSNLRAGAQIVTPVRWEDGRRAILRLGRDADGVAVKPLTGLTALDGTSSGVLVLKGVQVPEADVLTRDVPRFRDRARAPFLLIQSAMCLGLAGAALDAADAAVDDVSREVLAEEFSQAAEDWERLRADLVRSVERAGVGDAGVGVADGETAGAAHEGSRAGAEGTAGAEVAGASEGVRPAELVAVRLDSALLAGSATRLEQKVVGGRGYALASDTSRRAREAAFLPVQSPTEIHLRHLRARAAAEGSERA